MFTGISKPRLFCLIGTVSGIIIVSVPNIAGFDSGEQEDNTTLIYTNVPYQTTEQESLAYRVL